MGGLFGGGSTVAPVAALPSNEGQDMMMQMMAQQNSLAMEQQMATMGQMREAEQAQMTQDRELAERESNAKMEKTEREERVRKGKKDLLFKNALGTGEDEEDGLSNMMKLSGGA